MNNCCVSVRESQVRDTSFDRDLREAVARGKQERQAVLRQVRQRRAVVLKRMAVQYRR
jgi:hypothetical protein